MNSLLLLQRKVILLVLLTWISLYDATAQTATNKDTLAQQVIAITPKGSIIRAPASLRVNVQVLAASPVLLISIENRYQRSKEVIINLRNSQNRIIHRIRTYKASIAAKIDLSGLQTGSYQVEVANRDERYHYELQVESKAVRSMHLNPQAFISYPATS